MTIRTTLATCGLMTVSFAAFSGCGLDRKSDDEAPHVNGDVADSEFNLAGFEGEDATGADTVSCRTLENGAVAIFHHWQDALDGTNRGNVQVDRWSPGSFFGTADAAHPNTGYANKSGSIVNGAPTGTQRQTLGCGSTGQLQIGWRFSNNVAGLANHYTISRSLKRTSTSGIKTTIFTAGERSAIYVDPATSGEVYFDERFADGAGQSTLTRSIAIGSAASPNIVRISRQAAVLGADVEPDAADVASIQVYTFADHPIIETQTRRLADGNALTELHLNSGAYVAKFAQGAVVRTEVTNLVFRRAEGADAPPYVGVCRPQSGHMQHVISHAWSDRPALSVTAELDFTEESKTTAFSCSESVTAAECDAIGASALSSFAPPACLY